MDIIGLIETGNALQLQWGDGTERRFPYEWLRDNCTCEACGTSVTGARFLRLIDFPPDIHPENTCVSEDGHLTVQWSNGGHRSSYRSHWLHDHCVEKARAFLSQPVPWDRHIIESIPRVNGTELTDCDTASVLLIEKLHQFGFVLINEVPTTELAIIDLAGLLGEIRSHSYAPVFDIWQRDNADILSNTQSALNPHVDEPFLNHQPGLFLLHCLEPSPDGGGDSILVDGFMLGKTLKSKDPSAFAALCEIPIPHHRYRDGDFEHYATATVFDLDAQGEVSRFRFAERSAAPLVASEPLVQQVYSARRALLNLAYAPEYQLQIALSRGDALLIDNYRLMHGRTGIGGQRHMRQCNINRDDAWSRYRMACRKRDRRPIA